MNSEQGLSTPSAAVNDVRDELSGIRAQLENMHSTIDLARDANIATHTAMHSAHREMANELKQFVSSELTVIQDELKDVCAHLQQQQKVAQQQVLKLLCLFNFVCLFVCCYCLFVCLLVCCFCLFVCLMQVQSTSNVEAMMVQLLELAQQQKESMTEQRRR